VVKPVAVEGGTTFIPGTNGDDTIEVQSADAKGTTLNVLVNGQPAGAFATPGIGILGLKGDDTLTTSGVISRRMYFFGGDGNDTIDVASTIGATVLVGGAGDDTVGGGSGRDILIGAEGADNLDGRDGEDILFGLLLFADDPTRLRAVLNEWARTPTPYEERVDHLLDMRKGGLNGNVYLDDSTAVNDGEVDIMTGGGGRDLWYSSAATQDLLTDPDFEEALVQLD
jgi:Ca2+-binding RTX toxin-like protein